MRKGVVVFKKSSKGVSLIEAFLAAIIFAISVSAIFATLYSLRKPAINNEQTLEAARVTSNFLDSLRSKIDTRDMSCGNDYCGDLTDGSSAASEGAPHTTNINNYSISWVVSCVDPANPSSNIACNTQPNLIRRVDATTTWTDAML